MDTAKLERIILDLKSEEERLGSRRAELQDGLNAVDSELRRVQSGLKALGGKTTSKSKNGKPSPNKDVVRKGVCHCLAGEATQRLDELKESVGEYVKSAGFSRMGLALRLQEVLEEDFIVKAEDGYRLAEVHQPENGFAIAQ